MKRQHLVSICIALLTLTSARASPAWAQGARQLFRDPGLILETGARLGACDVLTFTPDGRHLLATGDDKVVRSWRVLERGIDRASIQNLRWSIFREQRGSIYAMALSPDQEARFVAIGGLGIRNGSVAVLDRFTGEVKDAITEAKTPNAETIWAIAFSPSGARVAYGTADGSVWLWDLQQKNSNQQRRLGRYAGDSPSNRVCLLTFLNEQELLSVAQDGQVARWHAGRTPAGPTKVFRFQGQQLSHVAMSPDRKWLAAADQSRRVPLEVASLDGKESRVLPLPGESLANALAFDARGQRLAVGLRVVPAEADFFKVVGGSVVLFDLRQRSPQPQPGPRVNHYPEAVAFHPDGRRLAVADANNYEVTLWDLSKLDAPLGQVESPGHTLWSVGLDPAGTRIGFRDRRRADPPHPNQRGEGPWQVFDLRNRKWAASTADFRPVAPVASTGGWRIVPSQNGYVWSVVGPTGKSFPLELTRENGMPQCYTFLKSADGKPVRLAVGHYWGITIFELGAHGPRPTRLFTGHQGAVLAVAPSADGRLLVSASRDQTLATWSLADWPSQAELGARFKVQKKSLVVDRVDPASPAWMGGLTAGDEVVHFAYRGKTVDGGPEKWREQLERPEPGVECVFHVRRTRQPKPIPMKFTLRQRPLWRFFPTRDREWVLWRWMDYYYDCSTHGDSYVGWQVNGDVDQTPLFLHAEQLRRRFHRPDKVAEGIEKMVTDPAWVPIPNILPPEVRLRVVSRSPDKLTLKVNVKASGDSFVEQPQEVSLWLNDYRVQRWQSVPVPFEKTIDIPGQSLRRGTNHIIAQAYNQAGARGDSQRVQLSKQTGDKPRLFGLAVGISNYSRVKGKKWPNLLFPSEDARAIQDVWLKQKDGPLYQDVRFSLLVDEQATNQAILGQLSRLTRTVKPDDCFVLFLAGHGYARPAGKNGVEPGTFSFVIPGSFDIARPMETGLPARRLFDALAELPCRKLVLLDACHAYGGSDLVRELTPSSVGPIIISACDSKESAYELPYLGHGVFTRSILEAFGERFDQADRDKSRTLDAGELFAYLEARIPVLIQKGRDILGSDAVQTPRWFVGKQEEAALPLVKGQ